MGLFKNLFNKTETQEPEKDLNWIALTDISQLDKLVADSYSKPQIIFKHSTRCHISSMVIKQFRSDYNLQNDQADLYYLDLISFREVSNQIAEQFEVIHESPQLIVIKDGQAVLHDSHSAINSIDLDSIA